MRALRLALFAAALASCAEAPPTLEGAVVDALSGAPIAGARVAGGGVVVRTDAEGRFALPGGRAPLHAIAPGFLGTRVLALDGLRPTLALWPLAPDDAAIDAHLARLEDLRALRDDPDDPALRPAERAYLRGEPPPPIEGAPSDVAATRAALDAPPATIRVWRRGLDGTTESCAGRVDVIPFEEYVAGVLPHEWIPSWREESLRAGALAIRTYAWNIVRRGGRYDCADVDDTSRSQVYRDTRNERASAAVLATTGMAITRDDALVSGEYSAENGNPTAHGVVDPLCDGFEIRGHRRGMCQWGSQRWAIEGRDHLWIATHYYPGSIVEGGAPAADDYDARAVDVDAPPSLVAGARALVTVRLENTGRREWTAEGTRLVTASGMPSALFDDVSWIDAASATAPDVARCAAGETCAFSFRVTAPDVAAEGDVAEAFSLAHEGVGRFGEAATVRVRVRPRDGAVVTPPADAGSMAADAGDGGPGGGGSLSGGCAATSSPAGASAWLAALALALVLKGGRSIKSASGRRRHRDQPGA
ncbi:MAG: hypothetical protein KF729_27490 [Sandaracinaceae bacterium]|nr:hypothetical protein [Sandaracinaceae bacterium]